MVRNGVKINVNQMGAGTGVDVSGRHKQTANDSLNSRLEISSVYAVRYDLVNTYVAKRKTETPTIIILTP